MLDLLEVPGAWIVDAPYKDVRALQNHMKSLYSLNNKKAKKNLGPAPCAEYAKFQLAFINLFAWMKYNYVNHEVST